MTQQAMPSYDQVAALQICTFLSFWLWKQNSMEKAVMLPKISNLMSSFLWGHVWPYWMKRSTNRIMQVVFILTQISCSLHSSLVPLDGYKLCFSMLLASKAAVPAKAVSTHYLWFSHLVSNLLNRGAITPLDSCRHLLLPDPQLAGGGVLSTKPEIRLPLCSAGSHQPGGCNQLAAPRAKGESWLQQSVKDSAESPFWAQHGA